MPTATRRSIGHGPLSNPQKQSIFTALWNIMSGVIAGMIISVVIPQFFTLRQHPLQVMMICMIVGSFVGFLLSWQRKK